MSQKKQKSSKKRLVQSQFFEVNQEDNIINESEFNIIETINFQEESPSIKNLLKRKFPLEDEEKITPMKSQYYEAKAQYRNSIILFQRGQFYQAYDQDAMFIHQYLGYNWKNMLSFFNYFLSTKKVIGIHEQNLEEDLLKLINMNQTVVISLQIEDAISHQERLKNLKQNGIRSTEKFNIIDRRIVGVYQKGIIGLGFLCNKTLEQYKHNYIIGICKLNAQQDLLKQIDFTVLDTINKKVIMFIKNIEHLNDIFEKYPPSIILISKNDDQLSTLISEKLKVIKIRVSKPEKSLTMIKEFLVESYFYEDTIPQLSFYVDKGDQLLDQTEEIMMEFFKEFEFKKVSKLGISQVTSFRLNKNVISQLDIFSCQKYRTKNCLFDIINYTVTKVGEDLLINWISNPIKKVDDILDRQNAVSDLLNIHSQVSTIREVFKQVKNIQTNILWLYGQAQTFYSAKIEISYKPFILLKQYLTDTRNILYQIKIRLVPCKQEFKSQLLQRLLDEEMIENTRQIIDALFEKIIWSGDNLDIPYPAISPYNEQFNYLNESISQLQKKIKDEVQRIGEKFTKPLKIVEFNSQKNQHEIEIPFELLDQILPEMQLNISSMRQGFKRFKTPLIIELNQEEFTYQTKLKRLISEFQKYILSQFIQSKQIWNQVIEVISYLDALFSITQYSAQVGMTRPVFLNDSFKIEAKNLTHPILREIIQDDFISNSFFLENKKFCVFITGCNGSGKSTFMRAIGTCVILAQIGCYVPCSQFKLKLFEQIFVRMGAFDNILENRSTFYSELKEVREMIDQKNSLFLLDEIGELLQTTVKLFVMEC